MSEVLLGIHHVGKVYPRIGRHGAGVAALARLLLARPATDGFVALADIDFTVRRGESLALVGENGAGKSTLLKIIAGVLQPTTGRADRVGSVGALLELGAGFHPEYTGRENLKLAAALQGLTGAAFDARLDEIIAFADIGEHIDAPIKTYSSGMVVRLGFALVTALKPDLLITDEVLAVGDESFQNKCIAWMERYLADGGTLLLVSHSLYHVKKLTQRAVWLDHGRLRMIGASHEVAIAYQAFHEAKQADAKTDAAAVDSAALGQYAVTDLSIERCDADGLSLHGSLKSRDGRRPHVALGVVRIDGTPVYGTTSEIDGAVLNETAAGNFEFALTFSDWRLLPGAYRLRAHALDPEGMRVYDTVERDFTVAGDSRELGLVRLPHHWN
ncbi:MAG TPA: ABC transporter ATP-binding protein [Casimicrobium huifangae]|jgi:lipopolysaccharide transport system ATP-binding protein|uniref:ABC transporter ATP-binding protein n=1 Tax=Casimicrobium huifangae TaxID=2591109 RepID=UPI0012EB08DE|nr:ABC transporter ATP-binding protein [Casimicrobium huifangae]HOB01667.1 ABC transporter ATP-binding protein [Casimicrobium huifangae]HQA32322.1 ABC transporter ATP-binding protein [Casimicrobium huifangae]HQD64073.1 ABC transporter ATP-binding protein [Casimicrobium huifangae]